MEETKMNGDNSSKMHIIEELQQALKSFSEEYSEKALTDEIIAQVLCSGYNIAMNKIKTEKPLKNIKLTDKACCRFNELCSTLNDNALTTSRFVLGYQDGYLNGFESIQSETERIFPYELGDYSDLFPF